jgi:hypothetical protein
VTRPSTRLLIVLPVLLLASTASVWAQQTDDATSEPKVVADAGRSESHRMFGVLPNYAMVETSTVAAPITTKQTFAAAAKNSFDPFVFSFVGFTTALGQGGTGDYAQRYMTMLADTTIGNMMTSAVMPAALHYDPRYYESGTGGVLRRTSYALSRTLVTRTRSGEKRFNVPEIGGNLAAASISNVYYAPADRSVAATLTRWGTQVMWDAVSNELKEFWPDIRAVMQSRRGPQP